MTSSSSSSTSFCNIRVLVGLAEHNYSLSPDTTMQAVVEMILKDEKVVKPMKVRLIHKGKALHQRGTIQSNGIVDASVIHAVISPVTSHSSSSRQRSTTHTTRPSRRRPIVTDRRPTSVARPTSFRNFSAGHVSSNAQHVANEFLHSLAQMANEADTSDDDDDDRDLDNSSLEADQLELAEMGANRVEIEYSDSESSEEEERGFDTLRRFGFTPVDIAAVRANFFATRERPSNHNDVLQMEEDWMNRDSTIDDEDVQAGLLADRERAEQLGSSVDLMFGLLAGFTLSFLSLSFIGQQFISRRAKFGLLLGILFNIFMGLFRVEQLL